MDGLGTLRRVVLLSLSVEIEDGLSFEDGLMVGESVEGVQLQAVTAGFIVKIAEGDQFVACGLGIGDIHAAFFGHAGEVGVGLAKEVGAHGFDLEVHHVVVLVGPGAFVTFFAAESEALHKSAFGEHLVWRANEFGHAMRSGENTGHMAAARNPDDDLISTLKELSRGIDVKQFGMDRSFVQVERQFAQ